MVSSKERILNTTEVTVNASSVSVGPIRPRASGDMMAGHVALTLTDTDGERYLNRVNIVGTRREVEAVTSAIGGNAVALSERVTIPLRNGHMVVGHYDSDTYVAWVYDEDGRTHYFKVDGSWGGKARTLESDSIAPLLERALASFCPGKPLAIKLEDS